MPSKAERAAPVVLPKKKKKAPKPVVTLPDNVVFLPAANHRDHRDKAKARSKSKMAKPAKRTQKRVAHAKAEPARKDASKVEDKELEVVKSKVREAMEALEQGKQIAAFNILKRIVDE
jgi:hypothetical protein